MTSHEGSGPRLADLFGSHNVDTFLGLPQSDVSSARAKAAILGVPHASPYRSVGSYAANAPRAIRAAAAPFAANRTHVNFDVCEPLLPDGEGSVVDCGDLAVVESDPDNNRRVIREAVKTLVDNEVVPIVLGGDDSVPIPLFEAFDGRGPMTVFQIDAHIDWRDEVEGERFGLSSNMRRASEMEHVAAMIQVGQRAIGSARPSDYADALQWGVSFVAAREVARGGIEPILELVPPENPVLFALDIDGMNPTEVPGVIGRAPGGLSYWDVAELIHGVAARAPIAAFNLVEFVPERDVDELGANTAAHIVMNAIGAIVRQSR